RNLDTTLNRSQGRAARGQLLSRHGHLLRPQRHLHHVTWLKLGILLRGEAFPAVLALSNDGNLGVAAGSAYKLSSHQGGELKFLANALQLRLDLSESHASVL